MKLNAIRAFLKLESASGIILCLTAMLAILLANSPWASWYQAIQQLPIELRLGTWAAKEQFLFWVNDGLMTFFFLQVGLELKQEFLHGKLGEFSRVLLPAATAAGGMLVPILIYVGVNWQHANGLLGWAVPVATDIAFALGVLSLFGRKVPLGLKLFLMALAIFDDIGAIIIIAFFNTDSLTLSFLFTAGVLVVVLWWLQKQCVKSLSVYLTVGFLLWVALLKAGIHPTVAGVLLALFVPAEGATNPSQRLQNNLHAWVAYLVMPLFAFLNAGLSFAGVQLAMLLDSVTIGVVLGLVIGKQIGVFGCAVTLIKLGWASLPERTTWLQFYGIALLCGIGFTMSLFLGTLAFDKDFPAYLTQVRLGVLIGSVSSGVIGAMVLWVAFRRKKIKATSF